MKVKVVVIGGGPCGIFSSICIKKNHPDAQVVLLEKENQIASRIKISGNGRCNFISKNLEESKYSSSFVSHIIKYQKEVLEVLEESGLSYYFDEENRGYPTSESSLTVIQALNFLLNKYKVEVKTNYLVTSIAKKEDKTVINDSLSCDKVVVCIGGISYLNERLNYNRIISSLDVKITPLTPSLAPISVSSFPKDLENKKVKCKVKLLEKGKTIFEEEGEVLFKKDGLSGIVIFNLSSILARKHLKDYSSFEVSLDLLPHVSDEKLASLIRINPNLDTIFIPQLASYLKSFSNLIKTIRDLRFKIRGIYEFKNSQVTSGGISLDQINLDLSLKKNPNIYVGGELIDIDGQCGGYNIGYCLCSGYLIGKEIIK